MKRRFGIPTTHQMWMHCFRIYLITVLYLPLMDVWIIPVGEKIIEDWDVLYAVTYRGLSPFTYMLKRIFYTGLFGLFFLLIFGAVAYRLILVIDHISQLRWCLILAGVVTIIINVCMAFILVNRSNFEPVNVLVGSCILSTPLVLYFLLFFPARRSPRLEEILDQLP